MNYRNKANITLAAVCVAFVLIAVLKHFFPQVFALKLLYAVLEAALVGGIADWFAVTALFTKPLGFAYHTALIPRNRKKVIEAVARMVEGDLLSIESLKAKIEKIALAQVIVQRIAEERDLQQRLLALAAAYIQQGVLKIDPRKISDSLEEIVRHKLQEMDLPLRIKELALWALDNGQDAKLLDYVLDEVIRVVQKPETEASIYRFLKNQQERKTGTGTWKNLLLGLLESTGSLNLAEAAGSLHTQLMVTLQELKDPVHPIRTRFRAILADAIAELDTRAEWRWSIESWREDVLERLPLQAALENLIKTLIAVATGYHGDGGSDPGAEDSLLMSWSMKQLAAYWERFVQDREMLGLLDGYLKDFILKLIAKEHYLIGDMVRRTLNAFSDQDLNRFIEDKAGNDLQWIRINGSIIGGLVGLFVFLFVNLVYEPFIVPMVISWLN